MTCGYKDQEVSSDSRMIIKDGRPHIKEPRRVRMRGLTTTRGHRLGALGCLLVGNGLLLTHSGDDGDKEILAVIEAGLDLLADITIGNLDIILGSTVLSHEVKETIVNVDLWAENRSDKARRTDGEREAYELVFVAGDIGNVHVVRGGGDILL